MRFLRSLVVLVAMAAIAACERKADIAVPHTAQCGNVAFQFPRNWKITVEDMGVLQMAQVESPGSAIAVVTVYSTTHEVSVRSYTESFIESMLGSPSLAKIEHGAVREQNGMLVVAFVVTLAGEKVPHTLQVSEHQTGDRKVFCLTQAADEDIELVDAGFRMIRDTIADMQ